MEDASHQKRMCPIEYAVSVIGGKWKIRILYQIYIGQVRRYGELKKLVPGITHKMLNQQLKELENDNLIHREEYHQIPPKVEYTLTERGKTMLPILKQLTEWGELNQI
jgi:DNA-binding HxlR family transcriptional regulator